MRCVLTKENVKKLSIDFRPVIKGTQMVGIEANPSRKPYIVYDCHQEAAKGLALYIGVSKATFIVKRRVGQKIVTTKIGELGDFNFNMADESRDVREQARKISFDIKAGIDRKAVQQAERLVNQATLGSVLDKYLAEYMSRPNPRPNSITSIRAAIKRVQPWAHMPVTSIGSETIDEMWKSILGSGKTEKRTATEQTMMWCRAAFGQHIMLLSINQNLPGLERRLLVNPFKYATTKMRTRQQLELSYDVKGLRNPLDNVPERLGKWLDAVWTKRETNRSAADYMLLTLLIGARRNETAGVVWKHRIPKEVPESHRHNYVDLKEKVVVLQETKNGVAHKAPMGDFLHWLLTQREKDKKKKKHGMYVFPASSKNPNQVAVHYNSPREFTYSLRKVLDADNRAAKWAEYWAAYMKENGLKEGKTAATRIQKEMTIAKADFDKEYVPEWMFTMHDLRRTFCSVAVNIDGMPYAVVQKLMNHGRMADVTMRYGKLTDEKLRQYMQVLEDELLKHSTMLPRIKAGAVVVNKRKAKA